MRKVIELGLVACCLSLSTMVWAQAAATGKITALYAETSGNWVRVNLDSPAYVNPGACPTSNGETMYVVEFPSASSRGPLLSALYLAFTQRTSISMWVVGCTSGTYWGSTRPKAVDVLMSAP